MYSGIGPAYLLRIALTVALLMLCATVHEVAHGFVAHLCGDDTAKEAGRLTLNPAKHLDPVGSVVLPLFMALAGQAVFAYAKPVPYNPWRLKHRKRDEVLVALAGPASNLMLAVLSAGAFRLVWELVIANPELLYAAELPLVGETPVGLVLMVCANLTWVNLMLCFFNLIPLPPLDGSKVLCYFLEGEALQKYYRIQQYSMPILIIALYILPRLGLDPVGAFLDACAGRMYDLLLGA